MFNKGIRYYVEADSGEHIIKFAMDVVEFRKTIKRDIIAKFNNVYIEVNDKMTSEDVVGKYYELKGDC